MYILLALLLLAILITVHEFGHFLAARAMKIEVREFSVGMGPKIVGWKSRKYDTDFSIRAIPLGGFCAFYGEDDTTGESKDDPRAFPKQNVWKRLCVIFAGPLMNFVLAFIVATIFFCGGTHILKLLFGQVEPDVMSSAVKYMYFTVASFPFLAIYHSSASIFRAQGNSRVSMLVSLGMNLFNIAGNALCIFVLHMGVVGVALPTLVSRALGAIVILLLVQKKGNDTMLKKISIGMISAVMTVSLMTPTVSAVTIQDLQNGKAAAQSEVNALQQQLNGVVKKLSELEDKLVEKGQQIGTLSDLPLFFRIEQGGVAFDPASFF